MMLVYSNNGGNTWGHELWRSAGKQGDYRIQVAWSRLGTAEESRLSAGGERPRAVAAVVGAWPGTGRVVSHGAAASPEK